MRRPAVRNPFFRTVSQPAQVVMQDETQEDGSGEVPAQPDRSDEVLSRMDRFEEHLQHVNRAYRLIMVALILSSASALIAVITMAKVASVVIEWIVRHVK